MAGLAPSDDDADEPGALGAGDFSPEISTGMAHRVASSSALAPQRILEQFDPTVQHLVELVRAAQRLLRLGEFALHLLLQHAVNLEGAKLATEEI